MKLENIKPITHELHFLEERDNMMFYEIPSKGMTLDLPKQLIDSSGNGRSFDITPGTTIHLSSSTSQYEGFEDCDYILLGGNESKDKIFLIAIKDDQNPTEKQRNLEIVGCYIYFIKQKLN